MEPNKESSSVINCETEDIHLNKTFDNYEEVRKCVDNYQRTTNTLYYKRESTKVHIARIKGIKRKICDDFEYYAVRYCCIHGGKKFKSRSGGIRKTKTKKTQCPAFFQLSISPEGDKYIITSICMVHNHTSKESVPPEKIFELETDKNEIVKKELTLTHSPKMSSSKLSTVKTSNEDQIAAEILKILYKPTKECQPSNFLVQALPCTQLNAVNEHQKAAATLETLACTKINVIDPLEINKQITSDKIEYFDDNPLQIEITSTTLPTSDVSNSNNDISQSNRDELQADDDDYIKNVEDYIDDNNTKEDENETSSEQHKTRSKSTPRASSFDASKLLKMDTDLLAIKREKTDIAQQQLAELKRQNDLLEKRNQIETQKTVAFNKLANVINTFAMNMNRN